LSLSASYLPTPGRIAGGLRAIAGIRPKAPLPDLKTFREADARNNFASLRPVTPEWLAGLQLLVKGVKIDLNAKLNPDDA
jgi:hypothetical protein